MNRKRHLPAGAMVIAIAVGIFGVQAVLAQSEEEYVSKAKVTPLVEGPLAGVEGKEVIIKHFEFPPGFVGGKHWHPGPVFAYVIEGELTVETEDGVQTVSAGELFQEPLQKTMQGKNLSTTDSVRLVVFQVGDAGKPMMIKAE